jgi:hypothetical protein
LIGYLGRQLTTPPSLHVVLTPIHAPVVEDFLRDLREVAESIARSGRSAEKRSNYAAWRLAGVGRCELALDQRAHAESAYPATQIWPTAAVSRSRPI